MQLRRKNIRKCHTLGNPFLAWQVRPTRTTTLARRVYHVGRDATCPSAAMAPATRPPSSAPRGSRTTIVTRQLHAHHAPRALTRPRGMLAVARPAPLARSTTTAPLQPCASPVLPVTTWKQARQGSVALLSARLE